ncbi:mycofactocin biosynthesis chaperone MftB [Citricoccus sp. GCM10030269]|uniref:mycofactocin biosynthesis chaperone MftB n=1 Tax=Citricoccus sp. GCM10030269 TaxID=3273388 RepID=UPI00360A734D
MTALPRPDGAETTRSQLVLAGSVSVRPERFGALLYDFRTRKLMFLKTPRLAAVIESMDGDRTVAECFDAVEAGPEERAGLVGVIDHLLSIGMLQYAPVTKE